MKIVAGALLFASAAWANSCILAGGTYATLAATAGNWIGSGCTGGAYVAGNGDTANLGANSAVLTVATAETWTIGTSGVTGTAAVILGGGGVVHIAGTIVPRGDISSGTGTSVAVDVQAGGTFRCDGTQNLGNYYTYAPTGQRIFQAVGSATGSAYNGSVWAGANMATVTSDLSGGAQPCSLNNVVGNVNAVNLDYAAVSNIGTASRDAIVVQQLGFNPATALTIKHTSFYNSGRVAAYDNANVDIENSAFAAGINTQGNSEDVLLQGILVGNTKIFRKNVLGTEVQIIGMLTWDVSGNYHTRSLNWTEGAPGDAAASNADGSILVSSIRQPNATFPSASVSDWIVVINSATADNPHFIGWPSGTGQTLTRTICESPEDITSDGGECLLQIGPSASQTYTSNNLILLPSKTGAAVAEVNAITNANVANFHLAVFHATALCAGNCFQVDESGTSNGHISNISASILGSPDGSGVYKVQSLTPATPSTAVTAADYNAGLPVILLTDPACTGCTNQGRGYATKITVPNSLGAHDLDITAGAPVAPAFFHTTYRWATWDTLGAPASVSCTAWVTSTVYTYTAASPTCVSVSNAGVYGSLSINYRLKATHTSGAGTKPDSGTTWRTDWEYATDYDMRIAVVSGTTYSGATPARALYNFVGSGWVPTSALYRFTYPGDSNPVTNMGAYQMAPLPGAVIPRVRTVMMP